MNIAGYIFEDPWFLLGLLFIPAYLLFYFLFLNKKRSTVKNSVFHHAMSSNSWPIHIPTLLTALGIGLAFIALARPKLDTESDKLIEQYAEGIDIVIAFDVSGSMLAMDFEPNRLEASKAVAIDFIKERTNDRIGLVVYEGESFTQCPLTTDQDVLIDLFKDVKTGVIEGGTAIGMGLATAVNRLRESDAKSKVIILLTDGVNTHGKIHPVAAAEIAKEFGIRVYTIGVGTNGKAKSPVQIDFFGNYIYDYVDVKIDEATLESIAATTDGKYFRATDKKSLENIYSEIDKLEKDKIKTIEYQIDIPDQFYWFLFAGMALILIGFTLKHTVFATFN